MRIAHRIAVAVFVMISSPALPASYVQPLLRGAGQAVTLEPWTQAERNLLYAVRDFARFRQEFYVYIAAGQATFIPGVQAGVQALTGGSVSTPVPISLNALPLAFPTPTGNSAFVQVAPGEGARLVPTGLGSAPPQGYLSTLTQKAQLVNQYRNIVSLSRYLQLFRVYLEGGLVDAVQVGLVEQQLLRGINGVLSQQANFRNDLDQFKLQLGLPLTIPLEVDDGPLQPLFDQTRRYEDVTTQYELASSQAQQYASPGEAGLLRGRLTKLLTDSPLVRGTRFAKAIKSRWDEWAKLAPNADPKKDPLLVKLDALLKEREGLRRKRDDLKDKEKDLAPRELARLEQLEDAIDLGGFELALRTYERRLWEAQKDPAVRARIQIAQFNTVYRLYLTLLEDPRAERSAAIRPRWPDLPTLCVDGVDLLSADDDVALAAVSRAALENRLDLMNRRAQLTDSWRKIAIAANALLGTLNVQYHYDASSPAGALQTLECVPELDAAVRDGSGRRAVDPHQERVEILGLHESVGPFVTYALFLRRYGSHDGLLETILLAIADAGREVAERHTGEPGPVAGVSPRGRGRGQAGAARELGRRAGRARVDAIHRRGRTRQHGGLTSRCHL